MCPVSTEAERPSGQNQTLGALFGRPLWIAVVRRRTFRTKIQPTFIRRMSVHPSGCLGRLAGRRLPSGKCLRAFDFRCVKSNARKNHFGHGGEDAFGGAHALGGAEGKRLIDSKSSPHWERERLDGQCVAGTRLGFDRPKRIGPPNCDGSSDRSRPTRTQAQPTIGRWKQSQLRVAQPKAFSSNPPVDTRLSSRTSASDAQHVFPLAEQGCSAVQSYGLATRTGPEPRLRRRTRAPPPHGRRDAPS